MIERTLRRDARDGPPIAYRYDAPAGAARGTVFTFHGYGEHYSRYDEVVRAWVGHGLAVIRHDLRGHGHSGGPRGHIESFRDYLRDGRAVLDVLREREQLPKPLIVFGHSLGALIALHFALEQQSSLRGLALSSPFLGLLTPLPERVVEAGRFLSRFFPRVRLPSGLKGSSLTHDAQLSALYDSDPLGFPHVTLGWVHQVRRAQTDILEAARYLKLPIFCLAAGDDRAVNLEQTEELFQRLGSQEKELRVLPGLFHELLNETDRAEHIETFARVMVAWTER